MLELRVAVVTDVGVICTPASLSGSYWPNRVCIFPGNAAITGVLHLTVQRGALCDGGGYGCVSHLAFLAMSL